MKKLFTTESVTSGHPDKICDSIADAILDAHLKEDKNSRVACEVALNAKKVLIMGEITSKADVDIESIARKKIIEIGYDNDTLGFNGYNVPIEINITQQSPDIRMGVNKKEIGAGDQGIMYGYATHETANFMPLVHNIANDLVKELERVRKNNIILGLRPDGKAEVTVEYAKNGVKVSSIVMSVQHDPDKDINVLKDEITKKIIFKVINKNLLNSDTKILINPTGRFVIGGPLGDSGLTGRKIIVDTYGGIAHHGGGAFSGKDYTKVDRSAAYYARYVAKNIVASNLAKECEVSVSYAIGISKPVMVMVNTFSTGIISDTKILEIINNVFDFRPKNMIKELDLKNVRYQDTTLYSHFGKDNLPWEKLNKVKYLKSYLKKF